MTTRFHAWVRAFLSVPMRVFRSEGRSASTGTRPFRSALAAVALGLPAGTAVAGMLLPEPTRVFGGQTRVVSAVVSNFSARPVSIDLRIRLYQTGGPLAAVFDEIPAGVRQLSPLARTIESAVFSVPEVRSETSFLLQWMDGTNRFLATTHLKVYPTNLLHELRDLAGTGFISIETGPDEIRRSLIQANVPLNRWETSEKNETPSLAILTGNRLDPNVVQKVKIHLQNGAGVVWILSDDSDSDDPDRFVHVVPRGTRALVVLNASVLSDFATNPEAQTRLIKACRLALHPAIPGLPDLAMQFHPRTRHEP